MAEHECKHEKLVDGYYGHDCADCGTLIYPYGCAPWDSADMDWDQSDDGGAGDEPYFDCGWVRGMGCMKAGSEECNWECPDRANLEKGLRLTQARLAKRGKRNG